MSMNDLFGTGGAKPKLITAYTSGTGTYVPTENNARCLVRLQAAGSGGAAAAVAGGGGAFVEVVVRVPIAGLAYVVGAGGGVGVAGGLSSFGATTANPGTAPTGAPLPGCGGMLGISVGNVDASKATVTVPGVLNGVSGGQGAESASEPGKQVGFPYAGDGFNTFSVSPMSAQIPGNGQGNGSGGDSFYGKGGTTGNMPAATAYGAGGGINAAGRGGYIEIWDFGA